MHIGIIRATSKGKGSGPGSQIQPTLKLNRWAPPWIVAEIRFNIIIASLKGIKSTEIGLIAIWIKEF